MLDIDFFYVTLFRMVRTLLILLLITSLLSAPQAYAGGKNTPSQMTQGRISLAKLKKYRLVISFEDAEWKKHGSEHWEKAPAIEDIILDYSRKGAKITKKKAILSYTQTDPALLQFTAEMLNVNEMNYQTELRYKRGNTASLNFYNTSTDEDGGGDIDMTLEFATPSSGNITKLEICCMNPPEFRNVTFKFEPIKH